MLQKIALLLLSEQHVSLYFSALRAFLTGSLDKPGLAVSLIRCVVGSNTLMLT